LPRTRRVSEILGNLKEQSVSVLLSEANDTHVADLLARVYRIERGAVMLA
jgi:branched-chain amino acid transport system ATP-binding protein